MVRRIATWASGAAGTLACLWSILIGYPSYANEQANRAAVELCRDIRPGDKLVPTIALARTRTTRVFGSSEKGEYFALFPGFGLDKALCTIRTDGSLVTDARAEMFYD